MQRTKQGGRCQSSFMIQFHDLSLPTCFYMRTNSAQKVHVIDNVHVSILDTSYIARSSLYECMYKWKKSTLLLRLSPSTKTQCELWVKVQKQNVLHSILLQRKSSLSLFSLKCVFKKDQLNFLSTKAKIQIYLRRIQWKPSERSSPKFMFGDENNLLKKHPKLEG